MIYSQQKSVDLYIIPKYILDMSNVGRPKKSETAKQSDALLLRLRPSEKESFQLCADLAGISLSSWLRERLRLAAIRELEGAGRRIPFVESIPMGGA
jgi:predicted HicB family RNase H-like nuclease